MTLLRRQFLHLAAGAIALPAVSRVTWAETYPSQPVRVIVGFAAGGPNDILARLIGQWLAKRLGHPFVVENRPGAGSNIATEFVARAPADVYTLLISTTAQVINPSVFPNLKFDFAKDLTPVMLLAQNPVVLIAPGNSAAGSVRDLITEARAAPGKLTFASSGNGTFTHLYGELFAQAAGIKLTHVPYKGSTPAMTDVLAGVVDISFTPSTPVIGQVKAGKLKALAVIGHTRMAALPDVPTFAEAGVPGLDSTLWFGLNAPTGTPKLALDRLGAELQRALNLPDVKAQLAAQGIDVTVAGAAQFRELIASELVRWDRVVKTAGVKIE
jgi:tripartite-type tricarboxylate transporter receptor subunit TctC